MPRFNLFKLDMFEQPWIFNRSVGLNMNQCELAQSNREGSVGPFLLFVGYRHYTAWEGGAACKELVFFPFYAWQAVAGNGSILCLSLLKAATPCIGLAQDTSPLKYNKPSKQIVSL